MQQMDSVQIQSKVRLYCSVALYRQGLLFGGRSCFEGRRERERKTAKKNLKCEVRSKEPKR
jgi:hypothetical protein